ncbi:hypothetical protein IQ07DRAFT_640672 [Pyrenochaeta sp. DS3sAY3a]|nr:hypothetical protein IQ07DRAFT_640672 [Pyrenochaeta sp. DS3sAY3a]
MQRDFDQPVQASDFDVTTATNSSPPSVTKLVPVTEIAKLQELIDQLQAEFQQLMQPGDSQGSGTASTVFVPPEAEREQSEKEDESSDLIDELEAALIATDQPRLQRRLAQLRGRCTFYEQMLQKTRKSMTALEKHLVPPKGR